MNIKCAILSAIGAPLILGALVVIIWLLATYYWFAIAAGVISGSAILFMIWLALYISCKEHNERRGAE